MWAALAWVIALVSVAVAARRLVTLVRADSEARGLLGRARGKAGDDAELIRAVDAAATERARVAIVNEELADVARVIDVGSEVPRVAARVALAAGVALALLELTRVVSEPRSLTQAVVAGAGGFVAYAVCSEIGRRARLVGRELGAHWNELARVLLNRPGLADSEKVPLS